MAWFKKKNKQRKTPEALTLTAENIVNASTQNQEFLMDKITQELELRLKNELSHILNEVVDSTIKETHNDIEKLLRQNLQNKLESHLDQLVEQAIKVHLTKPPI